MSRYQQSHHLTLQPHILDSERIARRANGFFLSKNNLSICKNPIFLRITQRCGISAQCYLILIFFQTFPQTFSKTFEKKKKKKKIVFSNFQVNYRESTRLILWLYQFTELRSESSFVIRKIQFFVIRFCTMVGNSLFLYDLVAINRARTGMLWNGVHFLFFLQIFQRTLFNFSWWTWWT